MVLQGEFGPLVLGKDHQPGGLAVQAVDDEDACLPVGLLHVFGQYGVGRAFVALGVGGYGEQSVLFVDDDQVGVFVDDFQPAGGKFLPVLLARDFHHVSFPERSVVERLDAVVHVDKPVGKQGFGCCAADVQGIDQEGEQFELSAFLAGGKMAVVHREGEEAGLCTIGGCGILGSFVSHVYWGVRFSRRTTFSTWWVWGNMSTGCTRVTR